MTKPSRRDLDELFFRGRIVNGIGQHVELGVPGRSDLDTAPPDWPETLCPGSVNVRVTEYPEGFAERAPGRGVRGLDRGPFAPAFRIPQAAMRNNKLKPEAGAPEKGTAQVWRASLRADGHDIPCWVLRRIGSGLREQLELVSHEKIRDTYGLSRDVEWPAEVRVYGRWRGATG